MAGQSGISFLLESAHGSKGGDEETHWMGIVLEGLLNTLNIGVNEAVVVDLVLPIGELRLGREFSMNEEEGDLKEGTLLGELLDRNTSIL